MIKTMIVTAVAAFALATAAQAQERKPYASLREAIQEQGALREEHELMIKRAVCEWLRKDEEKNSTVTIFGNDITIRANYGLRWSWKNMDAVAKGIACWALMIDAAESERAPKDEDDRYVHLISEDSIGIDVRGSS